MISLIYQESHQCGSAPPEDPLICVDMGYEAGSTTLLIVQSATQPPTVELLRNACLALSSEGCGVNENHFCVYVVAW